MNTIHIVNPETLERLEIQKRNSIISASLLSVIGFALICVLLLIISLATTLRNDEEMVTYSNITSKNPEVTRPEMTDQVQKNPASPAAHMAKLIASPVPSPTAIPVPEITLTEPSIDFGNANDFGEGWGDGSGSGSSGGGGFTAFGKTRGSGMSGYFYDLKQSLRKSPTTLGKFYATNTGGSRVGVFKDEIEKLNRGRYSDSRLRKYYKANKKLNFTHLVMAQTGADAAPKAFDVEKEVAPSGWIVVYEGNVVSDHAKDFRFVGRYDDLLLIFINNKIVFDGSWSDHSGKFNMSTDIAGPSLVNVPMKASPFLDLKRGNKLRIVIGESPGGLVGGGIFIEEKDTKYRKTASGNKILPPFTTEPLRMEDMKRLEGLNYPIETIQVPVFRIE